MSLIEYGSEPVYSSPQPKVSEIPPYNPADYGGPQPPNPDPKQQQQLSGIYVTIDEAASEPEAVKPVVDKEKKQNGISSASKTELAPELANPRSKYRYEE